MTDITTDASIIAPAPGTTLGGAIEVFRWDLGGIPVETTWLFVGSDLGGSEYAARSVGGAESTSIGGLPSDGSAVFARVWYKTGERWFSIDAEYTAADNAGLPAFIDPLSGGQLDGPTHAFRWTFAGLPVDSSWIYAGTTLGGSEYAAELTDTATEATIGTFPVDRSTVNARLYFRIEGWWYFVDDTFEAADEPIPTRDELTRELQRLVGVSDDGIVGPLTIAALNDNWLGRSPAYDPSFAERFTNADSVVMWTQRRLNTRAGAGLEVDGDYGPSTDAAVIAELGRGGVVAAESFIELLDAE